MKILTEILKGVLITAVVFSTGTSAYLLYKSQTSSSIPPTSVPAASAVPVSNSGNVDLSNYATKEYVDSKVASIPTSKPQATVTKTVTQTVSAPKSPETSYLPITGGFSTQSLDWVNVPGTEFYLDLVNDYGESAVATWDAFIREEHGNGLAEARIYDATNNIVVANSEISTNNQASTLVTSANLGIWRGKNLYKIQMKSQKGFFVYFDSGRLKITNQI